VDERAEMERRLPFPADRIGPGMPSSEVPSGDTKDRAAGSVLLSDPSGKPPPGDGRIVGIIAGAIVRKRRMIQ